MEKQTSTLQDIDYPPTFRGDLYFQISGNINEIKDSEFFIFFSFLRFLGNQPEENQFVLKIQMLIKWGKKQSEIN